MTYVWVLTLVPVAQGLQGWRTYPYRRAGSPELAVVTLWWRLVPPRWCLFFAQGPLLEPGGGGIVFL